MLLPIDDLEMRQRELPPVSWAIPVIGYYIALFAVVMVLQSLL